MTKTTNKTREENMPPSVNVTALAHVKYLGLTAVGWYRHDLIYSLSKGGREWNCKIGIKDIPHGVRLDVFNLIIEHASRVPSIEASETAVAKYLANFLEENDILANVVVKLPRAKTEFIIIRVSLLVDAMIPIIKRD